jgi:hypothetical protein
MVLAIAVIISYSLSWGVENVSTIVSGKTQKKYERKAVLGIDMGMSTDKIKMNVYMCEKKCRYWGTWTYDITPKLKGELNKEVYDWLITQRFDKIVISPGKAFILTAAISKTVDVPSDNTLAFHFNYGSFKNYRSAVESYLNKLSDIMEKLLSSAMEARYEELPEKEKETFITTKAKELGIPFEIAKKLMSSAYVFAAYYEPKKEGSTWAKMLNIAGTISGKGAGVIEPPYIKISKGRLGYSVDIDIPSKIRLLIYRFDPDTKKFVLYKKELIGKSGRGTGVSKTLPFEPSEKTVKDLVYKSFIYSARAAGIALNTELKKDENFAIITTADKVSGKKVWAPIGALEDLRIDAPYLVRRYVNGKLTQIGFVKARHVAIDCYRYIKCPANDQKCIQAKQSEANQYSVFELVKGKAELKDQLREHPWTGLFGYVGVGMESFTLNSLEYSGTTYEFTQGGGSFVALKFGSFLDLGYAINRKILSEVWLDTYFGLGAGGDEMKSKTNIYYYSSANSTESPWYITAGMGLFKRLYIRSSGIYGMIGGYFNLQYMSAKLKDISPDYYLNVGALSLLLGGKLGYNFSPNLEITGSVGYAIPLISWASLSDSEGNSVRDYDSADVSGGLSVFITLRWHLPTVGPFVKFYSKPSTICERLKKKYSAKK